jgi:hypothetical protein
MVIVNSHNGRVHYYSIQAVEIAYQYCMANGSNTGTAIYLI